MKAKALSRYALLYPTASGDEAEVVNRSPITVIGEATLRGMEGIGLRKSILSIQTAFPHQDTEAVAPDLYEELLQLARPRLHSVRARRRALSIILVQIGTRQTQQLSNCLGKVPKPEARSLLAEIMVCLPGDCTMPNVTRTPMHLALQDVFIASQSSESHAAIPFVDFVNQLIFSNRLVCSALVESGFLDMLFCLCIPSLIPSTLYIGRGYLTVDESNHEGQVQYMVAQACQIVLSTIAHSSDASWLIKYHPISVLWPVVHPAPFTHLYTMFINHASDESRRSVKQIDRAHVLWRILVPGPVFQKLSGFEGVNELFDICRVLRPHRSGPYIADWALARYLTYIALDGLHWNVLLSDLADRALDYIGARDVFSRIVYSLLAAIRAMQSANHTSKPDRFPAIDHFLEFATNAAELCVFDTVKFAEKIGLPTGSPVKRQPSVTLALLDAGVLALWYAVAKNDIKNPNEFAVVLRADAPTQCPPEEHSNLLQSVQDRGLARFLKSREINHRKKVWVRLFRILLNEKRAWDLSQRQDTPKAVFHF